LAIQERANSENELRARSSAESGIEATSSARTGTAMNSRTTASVQKVIGVEGDNRGM